MLCALVVCTALAATDGSTGPSATADDLAAYQEARSRAGRDADAQVKLALWCEARGLKAERLSHLAAAILTDPSHAAARGLMGLVAYGGRWERPEAVGERVKADSELAAKLAEYNARRDAIAATAEAHWHLALWCEREGLARGRRPFRHRRPARPVPRRRLAEARLRQQGRPLDHRGPARRRACRGPRPEARRQAVARPAGAVSRQARQSPHPTRGRTALAKVDDPYAVPSVWAVFGVGDAAHQTVAVQVLGQIATPRSSRALATLAAFSPSAGVRRAASEMLAYRDVREYGGYLLDMARDTIRYKADTDGRRRRPDPPHLLIEGAQFNIQEVFDRPIASVLDRDGPPRPRGRRGDRLGRQQPGRPGRRHGARRATSP